MVIGMARIRIKQYETDNINIILMPDAELFHRLYSYRCRLVYGIAVDACGNGRKCNRPDPVFNSYLQRIPGAERV